MFEKIADDDNDVHVFSKPYCQAVKALMALCYRV